jgi:hypothetical protein
MELPKLQMTIRESLKLYSQRLNVFVAMTITYIIATNGEFIPTLLEKLPEPYRVILAPIGGYIAFMVVSYLRLLPQPKLTQDKGNADASD